MNDSYLKYKIAASLIALALAFASGRYSVNGTVENKKVSTVVDTDKTDHKTVVIDKKPTGDIITTITDDIDTKTQEKQQVDDTKTNVAAKRSMVNVSALVANDFVGSFKPTYGVSVSKEILGPITVGVFGLTNGTIGVSIGINF